MYLLSIFGCLFNVFFIPLFARIITRRLLFLIVMFSLGMSFCASVVVFYEVIMLKTICLVPLAD